MGDTDRLTHTYNGMNFYVLSIQDWTWDDIASMVVLATDPTEARQVARAAVSRARDTSPDLWLKAKVSKAPIGCPKVIHKAVHHG